MKLLENEGFQCWFCSIFIFININRIYIQAIDYFLTMNTPSKLEKPMNPISKLAVLLLIFFTLVSLVSAQQKCDHCGEEITGKYVISDGKSYHEDCYENHIQPRCDYCKEPIDGKYNIIGDKRYHPECYLNHVIPKCDICDEPLDSRYYTDFWGNSFHATHSEQLPKCFSCGRLICVSLTDGGYTLNDGRHLCSLCYQTAVSDDFLLESSLNYVIKLFASNGIRGLPDDIPISLVDQDGLKKISKSYSDAMQGFTDQSAQSRNGQIISRKSHIYILSDLPLIMFRAVLAHELLHVYLFENDLDLRSDIREGFCNLGSELVYQDDNSEYSKFRLAQMMESQDPDYGVGYRKMSKHLYQKGWMYLLDILETIR